MIRKSLAILSNTVEAMGIICIVLVMLVILIQVVARYVFNAPLVWSEEAARLLFIWSVFLGTVVAYDRKAHPAVLQLVSKLPGRWRRLVETVVLILIIGILAYLLFFGFQTAFRFTNSRTVGIKISWSYIYAAVPTAAAAMLPFALRDLIAALSPRAAVHTAREQTVKGTGI